MSLEAVVNVDDRLNSSQDQVAIRLDDTTQARKDLPTHLDFEVNLFEGGREGRLAAQAKQNAAIPVAPNIDPSAHRFAT